MIKYFILFDQNMECKVCGTSLKFEAHDNFVCFDCYCVMDLARHEEEIQKKTFDEEEQECIPVPTPSHLLDSTFS